MRHSFPFRGHNEVLLLIVCNHFKLQRHIELYALLVFQPTLISANLKLKDFKYLFCLFMKREVKKQDKIMGIRKLKKTNLVEMKSTGQNKMGRLEISTGIVSRNQAQTVNNTYSH